MSKILTDLQEQALDIFFKVPELRQKFYLTGGTALAAYYLKHRYSDDLDFFTHTDEVSDADRVVVSAFEGAGLLVAHDRSSPTFRRYTLNGTLQVDLVRDIDYRIGVPELHDGVMIDTPKNITVNKVTALYGRFEPKDYVDFYFLLKTYHYDLMELLELAQQKDGGLELFQWAKIIADVETITVLPRMVKPLELNELKKFFHDIRNQVLDAIKP